MFVVEFPPPEDINERFFRDAFQSYRCSTFIIFFRSKRLQFASKILGIIAEFLRSSRSWMALDDPQWILNFDCTYDKRESDIICLARSESPKWGFSIRCLLFKKPFSEDLPIFWYWNVRISLKNILRNTVRQENISLEHSRETFGQNRPNISWNKIKQVLSMQ